MNKGKLRSVNTKFWGDNYIIELEPSQKLLFLYLITNERTNMLGIYETHKRRIAFDTCLKPEVISQILKKFDRDNKATYVDGYVIMHNFLKNQKFNNNMIKSAIDSFKELPSSVKEKAFSIGIVSQMKGLVKGSERLSKALKPIAKIEYESELECEGEFEYEREGEAETQTQKADSDESSDGRDNGSSLNKYDGNKYSISSSQEWDKSQPIDYQSFVDTFNDMSDSSCRMTQRKKGDIQKQLKVFTGSEIKQALSNRAKVLKAKDNEYLGSWESIFSKESERIEKHLNADTNKIGNGQAKRRPSQDGFDHEKAQRDLAGLQFDD